MNVLSVGVQMLMAIEDDSMDRNIKTMLEDIQVYSKQLIGLEKINKKLHTMRDLSSEVVELMWKANDDEVESLEVWKRMTEEHFSLDAAHKINSTLCVRTKKAKDDCERLLWRYKNEQNR